jgi:hypothetical protein
MTDRIPESSPPPSRPSRRALLRLAAGTALGGAAAVFLGRGSAHAAGCGGGNCVAWWDKCSTWCYDNGHPDPEGDWCHEACDEQLDQCEECCANGGDYDQCVPPDPPEKSAFVNYGNALVVAAELGYGTGDPLYGMLRARTGGSIGPWEKLDYLNLGGGLVAFRASNGRYVSAELGYSGGDNGMLRARAASIGPWEQFQLQTVATGTGVSNRWIAANGLYVSAELSYTGSRYAMLRARAGSVGPWEQYSWRPVGA